MFIDIFRDYRNEDGHINLVEFYESMYAAKPAGVAYLQSIVKLQPIGSRQAAAIAIANADQIDQH